MEMASSYFWQRKGCLNIFIQIYKTVAKEF